MTSSPKFKNLGFGPHQSPKELKEKMRKNYKQKIQNCRGMLMDKLRGSIVEKDLSNTLTDIYKSMFNYSEEIINDEEYELLEEVRKELVQEELEQCIKEYERCQLENVDWSSVEEDNNVICPVCQKTNVQLINGHLICSQCKITIVTQNSLAEIKQFLLNSVEDHNAVCSSNTQFCVVSDENETHVYLICENCTEMKLIV